MKPACYHQVTTLAPHCVPWHRPPGQVWCSAGETQSQNKKLVRTPKRWDVRLFRRQFNCRPIGLVR